MNIENENKLVKRFKFYHVDKPLTESLMAFLFECDNGWFNIIWDLSEKIEKILQKSENDYLKKYFEVVQVKEKYGALSFYTSIANDEILDEINNAEKKSIKTCEVCGDKGELTGTIWFKTLCEKCKKRFKYT